jgi:hypothetical protein
VKKPESLEQVRAIMEKSLRFARVSREDIDTIMRIAAPMTCASLYVSWNRNEYLSNNAYVLRTKSSVVVGTSLLNIPVKVTN